MSQRDSGYARKENDLYETPEWVTEVLLPHLPKNVAIWEPACGNGKIVRVLEANGYAVIGTDIGKGIDFLCPELTTLAPWIVTNPPYGKATEFIEHGLARRLNLAMLLRTDFDHAKTRKHLFVRSVFAKKIVLTKRIRWFEGTTGSPSYNHAWFLWQWDHEGQPTIAYAP